MAVSVASLSVDVGTDTSAAESGMADLDARIQQLAGDHPPVTLTANAADALSGIDTVTTAANDLASVAPNVLVDADTSPAVDGLGEVADAAASVADTAVTATVDADTDAALSGLDEVTSAAQELETEDPTIHVEADTSEAQSGLQGLSGAIGDVIKISAGFSLGKAITAAPGQFADMAKAAADDAASVGRLQTAVNNTAGGWDKYGAQINKAIAAGQKLAFSDDDTRDALSKLTSQTGDAGEALNRLGTAEDLARGANIDLGTAARLLGKVTDESSSALKRYGINVEAGATAQEALNAVDAKFGGQAGTFAASDAGKFAIASDKIGEMQEALGAKLLPALSAASSGVGMFADALGKIAGTGIGGEAFQVMAAAIGGVLVLALGAAAVSAYGAAAAFIAANAAALPWIALAAAIGIAVFELVKHWDDLTAAMPFLQTALDAVKTAFHDMVIVIIAGGTALGTVVGNLVDIFKAGFNVITTVVSSLGKVFDDVIHGHFGRAKDDAIQGAQDIASAYVNFGTQMLGVFDGVASSFENSIARQTTDTSKLKDAFKQVGDAFTSMTGLFAGGASGGEALGAAFFHMSDAVNTTIEALQSYQSAADLAWQGQQNLNSSFSDATGKVSFWKGNLDNAQASLKILNDQVAAGTPLNAKQAMEYDTLTWAVGRYTGGVQDSQGAVVDATVKQAIFVKAQDDLNAAYQANLASGMDSAKALGIYTTGMAQAAKDTDPAAAAAYNLASAQNGVTTAINGVIDRIVALLVQLHLIPADVATNISADTTDADGNITSTDKLMQDYAASNPNTAVSADTSGADGPIGVTAQLLADYATSNPNTSVTADTSGADTPMGVTKQLLDDYAASNPNTTVTADTATAETNILNLQGDIDGVPSSFTVTANVDIQGAMDNINILGQSMPHSPAERGPFRVLPNWNALTDGLTTAFADAVVTVQSAGTRIMASLSTTLQTGAARIPRDLLGMFVDAGGSLMQAFNDAADAEINAPPTLGQLILDQVTTGMDPAKAAAGPSGKDVVDAIVKGMVAGLDETQAVYDRMTNDALVALAQMQTDLTGKIDLGQVAGDDTSALQAQLDAVNQIIAEWAAKTGLDFQEEVTSILAPDVSDPITKAWLDMLGNIDNIISGQAADQLTATLKNLNDQLAVAIGAGAPQSVIDSLNASIAQVQAQLEEVAAAAAAAATAGVDAATTRITGDTLKQLKETIPAMKDAGASLVQPILDAVAKGAIRMRDAAQLFTAPMREALQKLEEELTVKLAQALLDGTDPTELNAQLAEIDKLLGLTADVIGTTAVSADDLTAALDGVVPAVDDVTNAVVGGMNPGIVDLTDHLAGATDAADGAAGAIGQVGDAAAAAADQVAVLSAGMQALADQSHNVPTDPIAATIDRGLTSASTGSSTGGDFMDQLRAFDDKIGVSIDTASASFVGLEQALGQQIAAGKVSQADIGQAIALYEALAKAQADTPIFADTLAGPDISTLLQEGGYTTASTTAPTSIAPTVGSSTADTTSAPSVTQNIYVEDRSPAAIAHATRLAGVELAMQLDLAGVS